MGERRIRIVGLGTYYSPYCQTPGANAWDMRKLVWHVKGSKPTGAVDVGLPHHPSPHTVRVENPDGARRYAAETMHAAWPQIASHLGLAGRGVALVPIPSSEATAEKWETARWGAADVAEHLEGLGCGTRRLAIVQKQKTIQRVQGNAASDPAELLENFAALDEVPPDEVVVLVDDVVTWGSHVAAADTMLGERQGTVAVTVAFTDRNPRDAIQPRIRVVQYDTTASPKWGVHVLDA